MHASVIQLLFKMAPKEVYHEATVVNNESIKSYKWKMKPKIPLLNKKVKVKSKENQWHLNILQDQ